MDAEVLKTNMHARLYAILEVISCPFKVIELVGENL
jgi:hypothetical protein